MWSLGFILVFPRDPLDNAFLQSYRQNRGRQDRDRGRGHHVVPLGAMLAVKEIEQRLLLRESCTRKRDRKQHGVKLKSEATRLKTQVENAYADSTS